MVDGTSFMESLLILVFLLVGAVLSIVLLIATWTGIKILLWHLSRKREERRMAQRLKRPDGSDYPPHVRGVCTDCGYWFDTVFETEEDVRLCWHCLRRAESEDPDAGPPGSDDPGPLKPQHGAAV